MLKNLKHIEGRALQARDGTLGEVKDFYFDDAHWHVRYLVVGPNPGEDIQVRPTVE